MGELTYKAKYLSNGITGGVKQYTGRNSNGWRLQGEPAAPEKKGGRRSFLGKVTGHAIS